MKDKERKVNGIGQGVKKRTKKLKFTTDRVEVRDGGGSGGSGGTSDDIDECLDIIDDIAMNGVDIDGLIDDIDVKIKGSISSGSSGGCSGDTIDGPSKRTPKATHSRGTVKVSSITQALIIITPEKQTELVQLKFITCLMEDLPRYQKAVPKGWTIQSTFINLKGLPIDLARRFNRDYEDTIETDIQIDSNGEVMLLIDSLESFDEHIHYFLSDWMMI